MITQGLKRLREFAFQRLADVCASDDSLIAALDHHTKLNWSGETYVAKLQEMGRDATQPSPGQHVGVGVVLRHTPENNPPRIMLLRRKDNGNWEFPGGKVERGEHPVETGVRELYEETGVWVLPDELAFIGMTPHEGRNDDQWYLCLFFIVDVPEAWDAEAQEKDKHDDLAWFQINQLPPSIRPLVGRCVPYLATGLQDGWI